jgi:hypothetical protein
MILCRWLGSETPHVLIALRVSLSLPTLPLGNTARKPLFASYSILSLPRLYVFVKELDKGGERSALLGLTVTLKSALNTSGIEGLRAQTAWDFPGR